MAALVRRYALILFSPFTHQKLIRFVPNNSRYVTLRPRLRVLVGILEARDLPQVPRLRLGVSPLPNACVRLWLEPSETLLDSSSHVSRVVWRNSNPRFGQCFTFRPILGKTPGVLHLSVLDALADGAGAGAGGSRASARMRTRGKARGNAAIATKPRTGIATLAIPMREVFDTLLSNGSCIDDAKSTPAEPLGLDMWLPLTRVPKAGKKDLSATAKAKASSAVRAALVESLERCRRRLPLDEVNTSEPSAPVPPPKSVGSGGALRLYISAVFDDVDDTVSCTPLSRSARANAAKQKLKTPRKNSALGAGTDVGERRQPYRTRKATAGPAGMTMSEATVHE